VLDNIQAYNDRGYLTSTEGVLKTLDDYYQEMAKMNYLGFNATGYNKRDVLNFVVWADIRWESAIPVHYPEYSGCGFGYRIQDNGSKYTALLTNDSIVMTYCDSSTNRCGRMGKTKGPGTVDFGNPAEATMTLIVNEDRAYVLVDGAFIGEYTLFKDKLRTPGFILYSMISGTNKDFGTRCEITNVRLWMVAP